MTRSYEHHLSYAEKLEKQRLLHELKEKEYEAKREKNHKIALERAEEYYSLVSEQGYTHAAVARLYGLSGERVRQILVQYIPGYKCRHHSATICEMTCANPKCHKSFTRKVNNSKPKTKRVFCSRKCVIRRAKIMRTEEEKRALNLKRTKDYYHRVLKNRPDFKERNRKINKLYKERLQKDPVRMAKAREKQRERYCEMKKDPVKWGKYLQRCREYAKKRSKIKN
jgi:hypothetical protein